MFSMLDKVKYQPHKLPTLSIFMKYKSTPEHRNSSFGKRDEGEGALNPNGAYSLFQPKVQSHQIEQLGCEVCDCDLSTGQSEANRA